MSLKTFRLKLYPLLALLIGLTVLVVGLLLASDVLYCSIYLACIYVLLFIFGYYKECLKALPPFIIVSGIFFIIYYYLTDEFTSGWTMANRFAAFFVGLLPGVGTTAVRMTRNLSQLKTPRALTLGMLIAMSFMPLLRQEIKRVREAMKTRGAGNILNPKILYRAFLIPFVTRLVNISDTLALSVETRGFTLAKVPYTVYKPEKLTIVDLLFTLIFITLTVLVFVL